MVGSAAALAGCGESRGASPPVTRTSTHVDSILPRAEALRRFRQGTHPTDTLTSGAPSRDALVRAFVGALAARDTARLARLALDRNEFAYLYYPTAPQGLPPYDLPPDLMWFTLQTGSDKGLQRAPPRAAIRRPAARARIWCGGRVWCATGWTAGSARRACSA